MVAQLKLKNIFTGFSLLVSVCTLLTLFFAAWYFSDKGFELSDEAFYVYFSDYTPKYEFLHTNFGILNNMICFGSPTLIHLRTAKLLLQIAAALFFFFGLRSFLLNSGIKQSRSTYVLVALLLVISVFINYDYLPMTLSYNSWSLVLSLLAFGVLLMDFGMTHKIKMIMSSVFFGIICFAAFLSKFPNLFIFLFLFFVIHVFIIRQKFLLRSLGVIGGIALGYVFFVNDTGLFKLICSNYYDAIFGIKHMSGHSYANDFNDIRNALGGWLLIGVQLFVLLSAFYLQKIFRNSNLSLSMFFGLIVLNFIAASKFVKGNSVGLPNDFLMEMIFILNTFYYIIYVRQAKGPDIFKMKRPFVILTGLLFVMPFFCMFGTNNPFYYTASHFFIFFVGAIVLLILPNKKDPTLILSVLSLFLCVGITISLWNGAVKTPYRQADLTEKKYRFSYGLAQNIYESYPVFSDYVSIHEIMKKLNPSKEPFFSFATTMGISQIAEAPLQPATWVSDSPDHVASCEFILKKGKFSNEVKLLVMPKRLADHEKFINLFRKFNVNFKDNYKLEYSYRCASNSDTLCFYKKREE
jgi:hypothetical protein